MAGRFAKIYERKEHAVIAVHVRSLSTSSSVFSLDSVGQADLSGLLLRREDSTNTVRSFTTSMRPIVQPSVKRTVQYAVSRYDNLLRKLAE